jgi:hypothetical protein
VTPDEDRAEQERLQALFDACVADETRLMAEGASDEELAALAERFRATDGLRSDYRQSPDQGSPSSDDLSVPKF